MQLVRITNSTKPTSCPIQARYCSSFLCRFRGLMFQKMLKPFEGLLMVQTRADRLDSSIHMLFMGFDLTVVWLDENYRVVDVKTCRRWKPAYFPISPAKYVLEIHPDRLAEFRIGDQVLIQPCN